LAVESFADAVKVAVLDVQLVECFVGFEQVDTAHVGWTEEPVKYELFEVVDETKKLTVTFAVADFAVESGVVADSEAYQLMKLGIAVTL
jgi:hypothetical protein